MKNRIAVVAVFLLFAACAETQPLYKTNSDSKRLADEKSPEFEYRLETHDFDDIEDPTHQTRLIFFSDRTDEISIIKSEHKNKRPTDYFIWIFFSDTDWRFMPGAVKIKLGDRLYKYVDRSPIRNVIGNGYVSEHIWIVINKEFIRAMARAKSFQIQYHLSPYTINEDAVKAINKFYIEEVFNSAIAPNVHKSQ